MKKHTTEVTYDPEADMAYVYVTEGRAGQSVAQVIIDDDELPTTVVVDLDRDGRILGFELFDGAKCLPEKLLDEFR